VSLHAPPAPADLGETIERVVARIIREGHYASRDEVLRAGVMALENVIAESAALANPVFDGPDLGDDEEAIREGLADIEAGRVRDAEDVFRDLRERYRSR
jgi:antitoxin ParD1/3/4